MNARRATTYRAAGVDDEAASAGLSRLADRIRATWPPATAAHPLLLDLRKFANVIDLGGGLGIALCADGVGSKVMIAQMTGRYDTVGIDCVAMCVNDLVCVGATPVAFLDYLAVERVEPAFMDDIARGLAEGARRASVSIAGGETAQLPDMIKGHGEGLGFDLVGMAIGTVRTDRILVGRGARHGDAVIGVESSGVHSNGLTLARHVFFERHALSPDAVLPGLERPLGEELLAPTHIYVAEALDLLDRGDAVKALVHITGEGFLNLTRVEAEVGFVLDSLPPPPPIFELIGARGEVPAAEMFAVYNMGIGLCVVAEADEADALIRVLADHGRRAWRIGRVDDSMPGRVEIRGCAFAGGDLLGEGGRFRRP